jgi:hypothetical protein
MLCRDERQAPSMDTLFALMQAESGKQNLTHRFRSNAVRRNPREMAGVKRAAEIVQNIFCPHGKGSWGAAVNRRA